MHVLPSIHLQAIMQHCVRRRNSHRCPLLVALFCLCGAGAGAAQQQSTILVGAFVETNYSTQPGVQVAYSHPKLLGGAPRLTASYSSTRLATALGSNALAEDRFQAGAGWYFRRGRTLSPSVAANVGYARFDLEDEQLFALLDNGAPFVSLLLGTEARLGSTVRVSGNVGYAPIQSSTVYPVVAAVGVHYHLNRGNRP